MNKIRIIAGKIYDGDQNNSRKPSKTSTSSDDTIVSRKQSASDLQSRLKTRKLLGVGELARDNGDIYKSKVSQLLGINESLYVRLPRGMFVWNTLNSLHFFLTGGTCLFFPKMGMYLEQGIGTTSNDSLIIARYYGVSLILIGILFRILLRQRETRADIAVLLLVTALFHFITIIISGSTNESLPLWFFIYRGLFIIGNLVYHAFVDGQGGLHRQLIKAVEDHAFASYSSMFESKVESTFFENPVEKLNYEDGKKKI